MPHSFVHHRPIGWLKNTIVVTSANERRPASHPLPSNEEETAAPIDQRGVIESSSTEMTAGDLFKRAKAAIGSGETSRNISYRDAAEDIYQACRLEGVTHRKAAKAVGKSPAWINGLLKWKEGGYVGAPFADKVVQAPNNSEPCINPSLPESEVATVACPSPTGDVSTASACLEPIAGAIATVDPTEIATALAQPPANIRRSAPPASELHLPPGPNRQDPERAFERLAEEWSLTSFRHLLLDAPEAAQVRFLRDVLLPELNRPDVVGSPLSHQGSAR
jgi:hypothetical protein